jgi:hypothetical protein
LQVKTPFNRHIPKTLKENLEWRRDILQAVVDDPSVIELIIDACSQDPLFFINGFCWTYDPRNEENPKLPFILYPFQEDAVMDIIAAIGSNDLLIEKSRDMGASWITIAAMTWCWRFRDRQSFLFVSRVEEYVDKPGNPKAMFWKFDFLLDSLVSWLRPRGYNKDCYRSKLHVENPENGSVIDGESTTGNVARGDRRTAILLDEFAAVVEGNRVLSSTRDATNCRLFNSTPNGVNNAFYDIRQTTIKKLRLHWSQHPIKSVGLYTTDDKGNLKHLDDAIFPPDYHFVLDGKIRSSWYDGECQRAGSSQEIAQELDIDYLGSGFQYFNAAAIETQIRKNARPPLLVGELEYDDTTGEPIRFVECTNGHLQLWFYLNGNDEPPRDSKYSAGCDVSAGTGASNSCLAAYNMTTCEKVIEYVNSRIRPEQFAKQAIAICKWLGNAYLIWESGGPGRQFGSRVIELGYGNIYFRKREEAISGKVSDIPGIVTTKEVKMLFLGEYRSSVEKGACINRSKEALQETLEYIFAPDGGIEHSRTCNRVDPSGAKANHGDRVIADALAWKALRERNIKPVVEEKTIPVGSLAWRNQLREQKQKELANDGWRNN